MKNKHLGKKTLSVFLAVMMLMTCWVWFAPEKAEAVSQDVSTVTSYASYHVKLDMEFKSVGNGGDVKILYYPVNSDGTLNTSSPQEYILIHSAKQYSTTTWTFDTADDSTRRLSTDTSAENGPVNGWPYGVKMYAASGVTLALKAMYINGVQVVNTGYWSVKGGTKEVLYTYKNDSGYSGYLNNWNVPSITTTKAADLSVQVPSCGTKTTGTVTASMADQYGYSWPLTYTINGTGATVNQSGNSASVTVSNAALANFTNATGTTNLTLTATGAGRTSTSTVTLTAPKKDVTFENLFSLSDWRYSDSFNSVGSPNEILVENDSTIKIYKSAAGGEITTGSSYPSAHSDSRYSIPVTGGKDYTVSFNTTSSVNDNSIAPEVFLFWYDVNNNYLGLNNQKFSGNGDHSVTFTAPETATKAEIRFDNDCTGSGATLRFNNIAVYRADRAAEIELETWGNRPFTKAYTYKAALGSTLTVPTRPGYAFNGWYLDSDNDDVMASGETVADGNGTVVSSLQSFGIDNHYNLKADWVPAKYTLTFDGNGGTAATGSTAYDITGTVTMPNATRTSYGFDGWKVTVADGNWVAGDTYNVNQQVSGKYGNATLAAQWTKLWTVTFLNGDGSALSTVSVRNGEAAAAPQATPTKAADANGSYKFSSWDTDFSNVTGDITVTPQFETVPHTVTYDFVSGRTCTTNAIVDKRCSGCNYYFFQGQPYDGTTEAAWIALGHDFEGQSAVTNTSDGETGTHEVRCKYFYTESCNGTTRVAHSFDSTIKTEGADCVTPGTVTKKCACGQETKVSGEIDSNTHNNTRLINVKAPTCTEDGFTGDTYCDNCKQTVKEGKVDPKLGHSFTDYVYNNDAKCGIDGTETAKCDRCDMTDTRTKTGSALEHEYTNYVYNNDAECEKNGTKTATCDHGCGTKDTIEAEGTALEHDYTGAIKNNGDGTHSYLCKNNCGNYGGTVDCSSWKENATAVKCECVDCGYTKTHDWDEWAPSSDNSGSAAGKMTRTCSDCGAVEEETCTYEETAHSDATCTAPETTTYTCTECGHGYTVIGKAATGHNYTGEYKYNADTDTHQQLCANGCNTYGVGETAGETESCSWNYANKESGKHTATCVCGNTEEQNCSGGTATCTAEAECQFCHEAYGTTTDHSFKGTVKELEGDVHAYLCEYCNTDSIYGVGTTQNKTEACSGGDATCTAYAVCEKCSDTYGELDADNHKWCETPVADADNAGKHIYTCEYNNEHKKSEACVSGSSKVVAPTCTEQGYTTQTCKECSYEWNTDYTDATDHNWVDPVCNEDGTHTLTCNNENIDGWVCDETLTLNCAESAITFGYEPATCTEQGYTTYQCTVCNYTWDADFVPATGHSYTKKLRSLDAAYKRSDKTCTEAETYWYRCDNCTVSAGTEADKYADNLASIYWSNGSAAGHKWEGEVVDEKYLASAATCTASAKYYKSCSVCEVSSKDTAYEATFQYGSPLGHDYQDIVDADDLTKNRKSEATCTSPAIYYQSCSRCGDVSTETFEYGEKIGHNLTKTEAKEPTCTEAGNVEYYTCSNCNKTFSDEDGENAISKTEISALGHDTVTVPFKAATCEEDGHAEYTECKRCHEGALTPDKIYQATGHKFTGAYTYDAVNGYHSRYCVNKNCLADGEKAHGIDGVKYSVEYDGLDYVIEGGERCNYDKDSLANTDENGIHSHKLICVCGNESSKAYTDVETFVETVAPNCTDKGYDVYKCPDCDEEWYKNFVDALDHDLSEAATPNGDGTHSVKCNRDGCDYEKDAVACSTETPLTTCGSKNICDVCHGEFGEAIDHVFTDYKYNNDATCTEDGTKTAECDNCDTNATHTITATGTKLGHNMTAYGYSTEGWANKPADFSEEIKEPTCSEEGLSISYCTRCEYYRTKVVKADTNAHVWEHDLDDTTGWEYVGGDCSIGVTLANRCEVCDIAKTVVVTGNHDWHATYSFEPTCTQPGIRREVCYVCEAEQVITCDDDPTLAPVEHTYGEETSVPANCTEAAHKEQTCTVCGFVNKYDFDEVFGVQHAFNKGVEYEATCETIGYMEYTCSECNYVEKVKTSDALGHKDANGDKKCDECFGKMYDDSDSSKGCGCICHKDSWLMRIIYKILNFFWKIFKISKSCECGAVHW